MGFITHLLKMVVDSDKDFVRHILGFRLIAEDSQGLVEDRPLEFPANLVKSSVLALHLGAWKCFPDAYPPQYIRLFEKFISFK